MLRTLNVTTTSVFTALLLIFCSIYFLDYAMPWEWLLLGFITVVLFFVMFNHFQQKWHDLSNDVFKTKLFRLNLILGLVAITVSFTFFYLYNGTFFEPGAADSIIYHQHGIDLAQMFSESDFRVAKYLSDNKLDDFGFNVFIGIVYYIFGPYKIFIVLINIIAKSASAVLVFKIANRTFGDKVAKTASLLMSLFPFFLIYSAINLKETLLIYLLLTATFSAFQIFDNPKSRLIHIAWVSFLIVIFFFFRTIIGIAFIISLLIFSALQLRQKRTYRFISFAGISIVLGVVYYYLADLGLIEEVTLTAERSLDQMDVELADKANRGSGLTLQKVVVSPLITISGLIAPFCTLVFLDNQTLIVWNFPGALIKNILALFSIIGIWHTFKYHFAKFALPLVFTIIYLVVLIASAQVSSQRYQLIILPFLCIFIGFGLHTFDHKKTRNWYLYLIVLFLVIFAWNFFKLYIRGL